MLHAVSGTIYARRITYFFDFEKGDTLLPEGVPLLSLLRGQVLVQVGRRYSRILLIFMFFILIIRHASKNYMHTAGFLTTDL